jgi:hypothetical protein
MNNVKLTAVQKDSCEGQITEDEFHNAIKKLKLQGWMAYQWRYTKPFVIYSEDCY